VSETPKKLIRELPLIKRYAKNNEDKDYRFRSYLKAELPLSDSKLDAVVTEITARVWGQIDCTDCGNCCRTLQIILGPKDISRLAKRLELTESAFKEKYIGVAEDKALYFMASPPCPFLADNNQCTVYEDRPQACRDYPFLHERNFRSRTLSMIDGCAVCPIVFNVWDELKQRFQKTPRPKNNSNRYR
jgi:uncharacterized protein